MNNPMTLLMNDHVYDDHVYNDNVYSDYEYVQSLTT